MFDAKGPSFHPAATLLLVSIVLPALLLACGDDSKSTPFNNQYNNPNNPENNTNNPENNTNNPNNPNNNVNNLECPVGLLLRDGACIDPDSPDSPFVCSVSPVAPCGGDVLGHWYYADSCAVIGTNGLDGECDDATQFQWTEYLGDFTFRPNGAYASTYSTKDTWASSVPPNCGGAASCDEVATRLGLGECTESDGICECLGSLEDPEASTLEGTYLVEGHTLVFDGQGPSPYCIDGDTLTIQRETGGGYEPLRLLRDTAVGK